MVTPDAVSRGPRRRSDAQRNHDKILAAAQAAFASPEADASMAEIARRAGVGPATLYRNFPDRRNLLEALYREEIGDICSAAETADGSDAGDRLRRWLREFYAYFTAKRALASELLKHTDSQSPVFSDGYGRILAAAEPLVGAARASGQLRSDLGLEQVLALVAAVANIPGAESYREPILESALDGLCPPGSEPPRAHHR